MARSADDRRRRKSDDDSDPGYDVLPDDESDRDDRPRARKRRSGRDDRDDDKRRRPKRRKKRADFVVVFIGIGCAIAAPICGILAVLGVIWLIGSARALDWYGIVVSIVMILLGIAAKIFLTTGMSILQGVGRDFDQMHCVMAAFGSVVVVGMLTWPSLRFALHARDFPGGHASTASMVWLFAGVAFLGVLITTGVLSALVAAGPDRNYR